ncbi:MAG: serpin family protein [Lachnospiraceae bacterium]|nr:serpin family protein [Lachnospiraceae bacterium]
MGIRDSVVTSCIGCAKQGAGNGENNGAESAKENEIVDLMQNVTVDAVDIEEVSVEDDFCVDAADFAIALLQENMTDETENVMVSPVSALMALAMTANGARGDTRENMLAVLAPNQSMDDLNSNIKKWADGLVSTDTASVKIANSVWFDESAGDITVNEIFLQRNALYYHADIYQTAFQKSTVGAINQWVSNKTDGMITNILDQIPSNTRMYLLNAVSFDAEWKRVYWPNEVHERIFTNASGEEEKADMMQSNERSYIEDENAVGFIKPYKEGYSFVALLPNEGMSTKEYIDTLSGGHFLDMLANAGMDGIDILEVELPKFEAEYEAELSDKLQNMGMTNAFNGEKADFSGIAKPEAGDNAENLIISGVHHKTYIKVDELGTKAAASSDAALWTTSDDGGLTIAYVKLNRPFVYAIVENETNVPIFIGVVNSVAK